jgi:hypothetical protein
MKKLTFNSIALILFIVALSLSAAQAQKLSAEDVVVKHLDSIGAKDKRAMVKNRVLLSDLQFTVIGSTRISTGKAVILSEADKNLWGFNLNSNDYPQERFAFDGKETNVGFSRPGVRSALGGFILSYKELLREGLLGGTLLSSWSLLDTNARKPRIEYDGMKKIEGQETHVLTYQPKGGSDLGIKMYFDAKNFRHLRTEYNRVVSATQGTSIDNSAGQTSTFYRLTEDFSNFQTVNGVTIPKTYKMFYSFTSSSSARTNREMEWTFNVTNFSVNQQLNDNSFKIDAD